MNKIEDDTESSNSELIKKYRFLFTLPKSRIISVLIGIFSYVAFPLSYLIRFRPSVFEIVTVASMLLITSYILPFSRITADYILILFVQVAINLIIFVPLLAGNFSESYMIAILLILPQLVITLSQMHILFSFDIIASCISGILIVLVALISLHKINKFSINKFNTPTFEL